MSMKARRHSLLHDAGAFKLANPQAQNFASLNAPNTSELDEEVSVSTPKGMRCIPKDLESGDKLHLYSDPARIVLQLRHQTPTEEDVSGNSFKVSTRLTPLEAVTLATELFTLASPRLGSGMKNWMNAPGEGNAE